MSISHFKHILFHVFVCLSSWTLAAELLFVEELIAGYELSIAQSAGYSTDIVTVDQWLTMKTSDFSKYKALIISDPGTLYVSDLSFLVQTAETWGPAITGNIVIFGTDPSDHDGAVLQRNSIQFASAEKGATGLYFSLSDAYDGYEISTVESLSYFGNFTVRGDLDCYDNAHIVASHPAINTLTDADLSNWSCSVHEAFSVYPSTGLQGFQALAIADGVAGEGTQNFANGHFGLPYILSRGATPSGCGDGHWDESLGEECDDGNTKNGDECSRSCKCESGRPKGDGTCYPSGGDTSGLLIMPGEWKTVYYGTSVFLCVLITVLFKSFWQIVLASAKMIEPFCQLHKPGGTSAKESLLSNYLASGFSAESVMNMFRGHWIMTLTNIVYWFSIIAMLVASKSMTIRSGNQCITPEDPLECDLQWVLDVRVIQALQAFYSLIIVMIVALIWLSWNRQSGIYSYPCSIASNAQLLSNSTLVPTLLNLNPSADSKQLKTALSEHWYQIKYHEFLPGDTRYGLVAIRNPEKKSRWAAIRNLFPARNNAPRQSFLTPFKPYLEIVGHTVFLVVHLILLGIFLAYRFSDHSSIFVDKSHGKIRVILSVACTALSLYWSQLEAETRIITPYRRLAKKSGNSKQLIEMSLHGVPVTTILPAIWRGNFYHAYIALTTILSNVLIVVVVGIPYNFGVIQDVSLFSSTTCIGLLGFMLIAGCSIFVWRWTNPELAQKPDTLANVMMLLSASGDLLHDFEGFALDQPTEWKRRTVGHEYRFKKQVDDRGRDREMVEVVKVEASQKA